MLTTKLPATPAAPEPWGSSGSRRALLAPAPGSCLHTSRLSPSFQRECRGYPQDTPGDAHQDFPLLKRVWVSRVMGTSPSQHAWEGPALPRCHTAGLCPMLFGGVLHTCWWKNTAWLWRGRSWMKTHCAHTYAGHEHAYVYAYSWYKNLND